MTQLQFYKYATLGLFLLNLAILGFFILTRPNHNRPPQRDQGFKEKAVHMLQLNDDQTLMFNKFAQEHNEEIGRISNAQSNKLNDRSKVTHQKNKKVGGLTREQYQEMQQIGNNVKQQAQHIGKEIQSNNPCGQEAQQDSNIKHNPGKSIPSR